MSSLYGLKNKTLSALSITAMSVVIAVSLLAMPGFVLETDQFADANIRKKIHFTQTMSSSADPSVSGANTHHIAFVLSPNSGAIYDGSMTFTSSVPTDVLILHAMTPDEISEVADTDLPVWTVDGKTQYAASVIGSGAHNAGAVDFTGAAVALYSTEEFVATASVDAWVRGEPTPVAVPAIAVDAPFDDKPRLLLSQASVPAVIPMHKGLHDGQPLFYIITDTSDADYASKISAAQGWNVTHAPGLSSSSSSIPETALQQVYVFRNGVEGDGLYGYQPEVFSSTPADSTYSALTQVIEVSWRPGQNWAILESVDEIIETQSAGRIIFATADSSDAADNDFIIANMHQIPWTDSADNSSNVQNIIRADTEFSDDMPYGGGQITNIDAENMTVTFVAHRSWGPDGQTTYHIVTGVTPERPAKILGVEFTPVYASLVDHSGAADMYIFENGVIGSGSVGFQPAIFSATPAASAISAANAYTPMWRVHTVEWNDPQSAARVLENINDIETFRDMDALTAGLARPTNSYYVINAPIVDPFQ